MRGVARTKDWLSEPTKIADFLAFADLKQAETNTLGGEISFAADLKPGKYAVFVKWYGAGTRRAPQIDIALTAPGAEAQRLSIDHRQEAHKWLQVGVIESLSAGRSVTTLRNLGGGTAAINSVAWTKLSHH
jgi:hypothetical protein